MKLYHCKSQISRIFQFFMIFDVATDIQTFAVFRTHYHTIDELIF